MSAPRAKCGAKGKSAGAGAESRVLEPAECSVAHVQFTLGEVA